MTGSSAAARGRAAVRDVIVVGAGPAGLVAARSLARCGHDVLVLEEHRTVGVPVHCTGLLGLEAFEEIELPRAAIRDVVTSATFRTASGKAVNVGSDGVRAAVVDRDLFDGQLALEARAAGAELRTGARVERIGVGPRSVVAHLGPDRQRVEARACVLACGASYRLNRQLGLGLPPAFVHSAQLEVPFPAAPKIEVYLGRRIAPGGFGWLVPFQRDGRSFAKIGVLCESMSATRLGTVIDRAAATHGADTRAWPRPRTRALPMGPVAKTFGTRLLAVGDAAGLVKPTTGGGIYYGLLSGLLAADVLDEGLRTDRLSQAALRGYEAGWRKRIGPEIRAGQAFRTLAARLDDRAIEALTDLARLDRWVSMLRRTANFNWHRAAVMALLRDGAFRRSVLSSLAG